MHRYVDWIHSINTKTGKRRKYQHFPHLPQGRPLLNLPSRVTCCRKVLNFFTSILEICQESFGAVWTNLLASPCIKLSLNLPSILLESSLRKEIDSTESPNPILMIFRPSNNSHSGQILESIENVAFLWKRLTFHIFHVFACSVVT